MTQDDEYKLTAMREYIWKLSRSRQNARPKGRDDEPPGVTKVQHIRLLVRICHFLAPVSVAHRLRILYLTLYNRTAVSTFSSLASLQLLSSSRPTSSRKTLAQRVLTQGYVLTLLCCSYG